MDRKGPYECERLTSVPGRASSSNRVQGRISSASPAGIALASRGPINSRLGETPWTQTSGPNDRTSDKAEERVIRGAEAIAEFIFGDRSHRHKVYYLAECSKIPIHRLGSTLCLRPSAYKSWIESQEHRAVMNAKHDA